MLRSEKRGDEGRRRWRPCSPPPSSSTPARPTQRLAGRCSPSVTWSRHPAERASRPDGDWRKTAAYAIGAVVAEVTLYYTLPLDRLTWRTVVWLVLGLIAFAAVLAAQIA